MKTCRRQWMELSSVSVFAVIIELMEKDALGFLAKCSAAANVEESRRFDLNIVGLFFAPSPCTDEVEESMS